VRLPLSEPWRAFSELDQFSDAQCRAYVVAVKRERRASRAFAGVCWVAAVVLIVPLGAWVGTLLAPDSVQRPRNTPAEDFGFLLIIVCAAFPLLMARLLIRDFWLRRSLRAHLRAAHCPVCAYVLLGLMVHDGAVQCPECGERIVLAKMGLTPESLLAPAT
jgi:hypothetical protein